MILNSEILYCLNTSSIRNCGLSLQETIELAARVGYDGIELWVAEIETYLKGGGTLPQLKAILDRNAIRVPNLIAFFQWANPNPHQRQNALDEALSVFKMAQTLGCPLVAAPPAGIADRADIPPADIAGYYRELLETTQGIDVTPLLEFWGHAKTLGSLKEALDIVRLLADSDVLLLADVFHMAKTEGSTELLGQLNGSQLGLFHLNDYPQAPDIQQLTDAQRVYPGDGVAPLSQIFKTLQQIGYKGMFSLELFNQNYEEAGAGHVARTGLAKTKQVVTQNIE